MIPSGRKYVIIIDCSALADEVFIKYVSLSFKLSLLFTSTGGILGIFFPFHKALSVAQYVFMDLEGLPSFFSQTYTVIIFAF